MSVAEDEPLETSTAVEGCEIVAPAFIVGGEEPMEISTPGQSGARNRIVSIVGAATIEDGIAIASVAGNVIAAEAVGTALVVGGDIVAAGFATGIGEVINSGGGEK